MEYDPSDTIAAVATGSGGALSVIRLSGAGALDICGRIFTPLSGKPLTGARGYTLHYGTVGDGDGFIDDVIVSVFRAPHSYTGEDMAEISCHGSPYIRQKIMSMLTDAGARPATPGEFTMRAFMAGKLDLSQAEAVADIIASEDRASHAVAVNQMRGGYSGEFRLLGDELLELVSLLELELDFSEEDVQFADRSRLAALMEKISGKIEALTQSYLHNNAIKEGIPVVIAGEPNTGKSTLLNALVKEDRAMVSDIAGTTRDTIEETHIIDGVKFRFTDTAGLRQTPNILESMGIERARAAISRSQIVLYLISPLKEGCYDIASAAKIIAGLGLPADTSLYLLLNKTDTVPTEGKPDEQSLALRFEELLSGLEAGVGNVRALNISAKEGHGLDRLGQMLFREADDRGAARGETIVTNSRHYQALLKSGEALRRAMSGLRDGIPSDLVAEDIRDAIGHMGAVTGRDIITPDTVLQAIFSRFCIGK
ncbi:MAG: tRNA uridine-5-carboxymethylaminomethyl(34) synthesis GTPase MnmE [Alistipes sp.]|nr:tRNA uridine-5-carboxymethylaminomethyl(34) synthesis GTPase MnmE [Alistipes sp.]